MLSEIIPIIEAFIISFVLFVTIDMIFKLPESGGVCGADVIGRAVESDGGDLNGGFMMGNIVCSPDASGAVLLSACSIYLFGTYGLIIAIVLVYIGNRLCSDKGYAGTTGAVIAGLVILSLSHFEIIKPEMFIAGIVLAIFMIQGISHKHASKLLGKIWRIGGIKR